MEKSIYDGRLENIRQEIIKNNCEFFYRMEEIQKKIKEINSPMLKAIEDFKEILQPYNQLTETIKNNLSNNFQNKNWQNLFREMDSVISKYNFSELFSRIKVENETIREILPRTYLDRLNDINITETLYSEGGDSNSLSKIAENIYKEIEEDEILDLEDNTSFEQIIEDVSNDRIGFQEKLYNKSDKYKKKYFIVIFVISLIFKIFLLPYIQENVGKPVMTKIESKIRLEPNSKAEVTDFIKVDTKAGITGNERYYYKIVYRDSEGHLNEGYISKRSVFLIEDMETKDK